MAVRPSPSPVSPRGVTRIGHLLFGGDYSPEQWPEAVWVEDARLMRDAGVNLVSLGVFAWSKIEVAPGEFRFEWLDRVIDLLHENGVAVNLATPTASPPPWLIYRNPDILPIKADGTRLWHGSRRHYCPHSPAYREAAVRVSRALADRYAEHPALAMWHVDNEYAGHVTECFCDNAAEAFRRWLEVRYGSLAGLNDAWGAAFWSQSYGAWEEVEPPRQTPTFVNPTELLDWRRFWSESWLGCLRDQAAVLREQAPHVPITTNFMGFHGPLDYWAWAREEDLVSNDSYPDTSDPSWMIGSAMVYDLMRSLKGGRPWVLMEQASAHVSWRERNATKRPGVMRLGSYQAIGRGADGIMFFQWRASRAGAEKHHSAIVPHVGTDSRTWREVSALGAELGHLDEILGSSVAADVAIVFDWENLWALGSGPMPASIELLSQVRAFYAGLFERQVAVDFAHREADLSGYRLVVVPHLYLMTDAAARRFVEYVDGGGTLLMTYFSGIVDANDHVRLGGYPAGLIELMGLRVEEFAPQVESQSTPIVTADGTRFDGTLWSDVITLDGAEPIATFAGDFYAGRPAVARHRFGAGTAFYVGTMPDAAGVRWTMGRALDAAGIGSPNGARSGIETVTRRSGDRAWLFVLNHTEEPVEVELEGSGLELLSQQPCDGSVRVEPTGVAIVRFER